MKKKLLRIINLSGNDLDKDVKIMLWLEIVL